MIVSNFLPWSLLRVSKVQLHEKPSKLSIDTPTIDIKWSIKVPTRLDHVVPEIHEQSAYHMQILKIGTEHVLTFFDNGANTNLVNGDLALDQYLEIITKKQTKLTVVGGGINH